jgi:hypothetical protein
MDNCIQAGGANRAHAQMAPESAMQKNANFYLYSIPRKNEQPDFYDRNDILRGNKT